MRRTTRSGELSLFERADDRGLFAEIDGHEVRFPADGAQVDFEDRTGRPHQPLGCHTVGGQSLELLVHGGAQGHGGQDTAPALAARGPVRDMTVVKGERYVLLERRTDGLPESLAIVKRKVEKTVDCRLGCNAGDHVIPFALGGELRNHRAAGRGAPERGDAQRAQRRHRDCERDLAAGRVYGENVAGHG
ncbi:MAG: hypothetical protein E4H03_10205 [Myxococcales bacterium]|nr:MAG: hypothetical protein E4H03_10205 [Myxococcales bacterium]